MEKKVNITTTRLNLNDCKSNEDETEKILESLNTLNHNFFQSEKYTLDNVKQFPTYENVDLDNKELISVVLNVMAYLYHQVSNQTLEIEVEDWFEKEMDFILERNHCVYFSLITKFIIEAYTNNKVNFNQGYYRFPNNDFVAMLFGKESIGFHAWCDIDGIALDTTLVSQQHSSYKGEFNSVYILGNQPDDVQLIGFNESNETIRGYMKDLLAVNNLSPQEWLNNYLRLIKMM